MSDCTRFRHDLLATDPDELSGRADSALGRHIRDCERCRVAARVILEATEGLRTVFDAPAPPLDADAVLARARFEAVPSRSKSDGRRVAWGRWVSVAAAAAIGGLLLLGERERPLPGQAFTPRLQPFAVVEAPADRNVVVIPTENPDITVLWFF